MVARAVHDIAVALRQRPVIQRKDILAAVTGPPPLNEAEVRNALSQAGGLVLMLADADRAYRAQLYRDLGLTLRYENRFQPGRNASMPGWSYVVAGQCVAGARLSR